MRIEDWVPLFAGLACYRIAALPNVRGSVQLSTSVVGHLLYFGWFFVTAWNFLSKLWS